MTVASCPSCQESVTVPVDATPDCVVRCPLCHEEFKLAAFLNQLPPSLIVLDGGSGIEPRHEPPIDADEDASSSNVLAEFAVSSEASASDDSVPAFDFTPGSVADDGEESPRGTSRRTGRPQKNTTVEVIKIVAGALLAIPAAQIILWLAPGDWKRDLLRIGPAVSRVAPWIVPEQFRAPELDSGKDLPPVPKPSRGTTDVNGQRARPRADNGSAMPLPGSGHKTASPTQDPQETTPADGNLPVSDAVVPTANVETNTPPAKESAAVPRALVNGVRGAPVFELADMRTALESALQASVDWDTNPDLSAEKRAARSERFYENFALLSETVTYPPANEPGAGELAAQLLDVLRGFAKQPKKLAMIGNQTAAWLDRPTRPNQGVFIFGTVKNIKAAGQVFETEVELAALQKRTLTVVSRIDPRQTFKLGERILMLGAIVEQPESNLLGYEGREPMVVMGGFPVPLR